MVLIPDGEGECAAICQSIVTWEIFPLQRHHGREIILDADLVLKKSETDLGPQAGHWMGRPAERNDFSAVGGDAEGSFFQRHIARVAVDTDHAAIRGAQAGQDIFLDIVAENIHGLKAGKDARFDLMVFD